MRPGLMMDGQVVMAPSALSLAEPGEFSRVQAVKFFSDIRVYVNGIWCPDPIAYDEDQGMIMASNGSLLTGHVRATPRARRGE